jgi:hypothetical protein
LWGHKSDCHFDAKYSLQNLAAGNRDTQQFKKSILILTAKKLLVHYKGQSVDADERNNLVLDTTIIIIIAILGTAHILRKVLT